MDNPAVSQDALISQFCSFTGAAPQEAQAHLDATGWNLDLAVASYYASKDEGSQEPEAEESNELPRPGRTLGGGPAPPTAIPTTSSIPPLSSATALNKPAKKFATLGDLSQRDTHSGHDHGNGSGDDNEEDYDDKDDQDLFAGGEKSGLAVKNPGNPQDHIKKIITRAKRNAARPGGDDPVEPTTRFTGSGQTLGGEDTPSQIVPDPQAGVRRPKPPAKRTLHLWNNGFSVDDGDLYSFDDPQNKAIIEMISKGRAPLHIMNVDRDQQVDVSLEKHDEDFKPQPKKFKPFQGSGQRLGSPTPGPGTHEEPARTQASPPSTDAPSVTAAPTTVVDIDSSQPTISIQVRLGDGTRLASRFNASHTIGDVYNFVNASSPASLQRPWVLMTTFPSKELSNKDTALGDLAELRKGGQVVQKWT